MKKKEIHPRHLPAVWIMVIVSMIVCGFSVVAIDIVLANQGYTRWEIVGVQAFVGISNALSALAILRWLMGKLQSLDTDEDSSE